MPPRPLHRRRKSDPAWIAPPERVDALFGSVLSRSTENTITDINVLHQELSRIRQRRGVAFEREESAHGVACVAAAVRGYEEPVGSIALCGNNKSVQLERLAPLVVHAVREISRSLYPRIGPFRSTTKGAFRSCGYILCGDDGSPPGGITGRLDLTYLDRSSPRCQYLDGIPENSLTHP